MPKETLKKLSIFALLLFFTISAFYIRLENFKKSEYRSIDEVVYYRMAKQMRDNFFDYNTIPYGLELAKRGRDLPKYFFEPLFKHPPVYTILASCSVKAFGNSMEASLCPSLLLGVLLIPLVFLIGNTVYGLGVGLLAAFFMWLDPITTICSQKVWMDTTIAFLNTLTVLFFVIGLKKNNGLAFILSGVSSGLAFNTKYSGVLITFIITAFCLFYARELFKNKAFLFSLVLPVIMLIPWLLWNYSVYGIDCLILNDEARSLINLFPPKLISLIIIVTLLILLCVSILRRLSFSRNSAQTPPPSSTTAAGVSSSKDNLLSISSLIFVVGFLMLLLGEPISKGFNFFKFPVHSWASGVISDGNPLFYFGQMIEFSPFFILGIVMILLFHKEETKEMSFIRLAATIIIIFFIAWGNFQSRYILPALPLFIILSSSLYASIFNLCEKIDFFIIRALLRGILFAFLILTVVKILIINFLLSFPNNCCYF
ncbi:MAG: glycosyltransferase family 39 protein [Candidatus Omnitrophica bacterium]|nr:glycosyltransferase family 39 protein [Candidatus Omnitrophota bacterium]